MSHPFNRLSSLLEMYGIHRAVLQTWRMFLADEFDRVHLFLQATENLAQGYPHPHRYQSYKVVYYKEDDIYAINPDDYSDRIQLTKSEVIVYEFNMRKFRETLGKMLGFHASADDFEPLARSIPLGHWEPEGGVKYPVHLLLPDNYRRFPSLVHRLFVMDSTPMIVLTPTRSSWDAETLELFRKRKSVVATLEEVMDLNSEGAWAASEHWMKVLTHFYTEINPPNQIAAPPPFEFRKKGDMWVIRFAGEDMYLKDSIGLRCIAQLLAKPNDPIFVSDLKMIVDGQNPQNLPAPTGTGEIVDREALKSMARKYLDLEAEHKNAKETGNVPLTQKIQDEMNELMMFMQEAKGFCGRMKESNDRLNSIRVAVYRAITRTMDSIKVELPDCHKHLEGRITTGLVLNYVPDKSINWVL